MLASTNRVRHKEAEEVWKTAVPKMFSGVSVEAT